MNENIATWKFLTQKFEKQITVVPIPKGTSCDDVSSYISSFLPTLHPEQVSQEAYSLPIIGAPRSIGISF